MGHVDEVRTAVRGYVSPNQSLLDLLDLLSPPAWHADAACQSADPDAFFLGKGKSADPARAICDTCPVQSECLDWAMKVEADWANTHRYGIWGGLSPNERARLARQAG